jgi:hypothetical protein
MMAYVMSARTGVFRDREQLSTVCSLLLDYIGELSSSWMGDGPSDRLRDIGNGRRAERVDGFNQEDARRLAWRIYTTGTVGYPIHGRIGNTPEFVSIVDALQLAGLEGLDAIDRWIADTRLVVAKRKDCLRRVSGEWCVCKNAPRGEPVYHEKLDIRCWSCRRQYVQKTLRAVTAARGQIALGNFCGFPTAVDEATPADLRESEAELMFVVENWTDVVKHGAYVAAVVAKAEGAVAQISPDEIRESIRRRKEDRKRRDASWWRRWFAVAL